MHSAQRNRALLAACLTAALLSLPALAAAGEFRAFFNHNHTIYSTDNEGWEAFKPSVAQVISHADEVASGMGLEAAISITDHNTIDAYFDPEFVPVGVAQPIKGEEWGSDGHACLLNFAGDTTVTQFTGPDRYSLLVNETHARGGIVIANHPRDPDTPWKTDRRLGLDAIEVWNTVTWGTKNQNALSWFQRLLAAGEILTAVAGSDSHFVFLPTEAPMNLVWCESNSADDVIAGVLQGRVILLKKPVAPWVIPAADTDGDGVYDDAMVGDVIPISATAEVEFRVEVQGPYDATELLTLVDRNGAFYSGAVGSDSGWEDNAYYFSRTFAAADRDFIMAEFREANRMPICLANPIFVLGDAAPTGTEGEVRGTVRAAGSGSPVDGVTITVTPGEFSTALTGTDGTFTMVVPNGTYQVQAKKSGYKTQSQTGVIVENDVAIADFNLAAAPSCGTLPMGLGFGARGRLASGLSSLLPLVLVGVYLRCRKRR